MLILNFNPNKNTDHIHVNFGLDLFLKVAQVGALATLTKTQTAALRSEAAVW